MTPDVRLVAFAGQQQGKELNEASAWPTSPPGSAWRALNGDGALGPRARVWRSCVTLLGQVGQVQCISYFKVRQCSELTPALSRVPLTVHLITAKAGSSCDQAGGRFGLLVL